MGFDGGHRAGYKQVAKAVDAVLITDTMGAVTGDWTDFVVISSEVQLASVDAPGLTYSSQINSGTTWIKGAEFCCSQISSIKISIKSSNTAVIAHKRILL
jgi:hypothetical protein